MRRKHLSDAPQGKGATGFIVEKDRIDLLATARRCLEKAEGDPVLILSVLACRLTPDEATELLTRAVEMLAGQDRHTPTLRYQPHETDWSKAR